MGFCTVENGHYWHDPLAPGVYEFSTLKVAERDGDDGYEAMTREAEVRDGQTAVVDFTLVPIE